MGHAPRRLHHVLQGQGEEDKSGRHEGGRAQETDRGPGSRGRPEVAAPDRTAPLTHPRVIPDSRFQIPGFRAPETWNLELGITSSPGAKKSAPAWAASRPSGRRL